MPEIKIKASGMLLGSCDGARGVSVVLHEVEWGYGVPTCSRQVKRSKFLRRNFGSICCNPEVLSTGAADPRVWDFEP